MKKRKNRRPAEVVVPAAPGISESRARESDEREERERERAREVSLVKGRK